MIGSIGSYWNSRSQVLMLSFLGQYRMVLCEFNAYTCGISIALAIHSLDPSGALDCDGSANLQTCRISIALVIHSFDPLGLRCVGFRNFIEPCNQHNGFQERGTLKLTRLCRLLVPKWELLTIYVPPIRVERSKKHPHKYTTNHTTK